ncbi:hypothetical protein JYU09_01730, partial [bacterium AH-315-O15]|nr:hypothetical protein [bacterium AH-315-O15]
MTRRRLSVAFVVVVLLGTSWADAAAQTTAAEVAATRQRAEQGGVVTSAAVANAFMNAAAQSIDCVHSRDGSGVSCGGQSIRCV